MLENFDPIATDVVSVFSFDQIDFGGRREHLDYEFVFTMEDEEMQAIIDRIRELHAELQEMNSESGIVEISD